MMKYFAKVATAEDADEPEVIQRNSARELRVASRRVVRRVAAIRRPPSHRKHLQFNSFKLITSFISKQQKNE